MAHWHRAGHRPAAAFLLPAARELCHSWMGNFEGLLHLLWPFTYYARFIPKIYDTQSKALTENMKITFSCDLCSR